MNPPSVCRIKRIELFSCTRRIIKLIKDLKQLISNTIIRRGISKNPTLIESNGSNGLSQLTVNSTNVQNSQIKAVGGDGAFHFFTYNFFMEIGLMFQLRRLAFESNTLIALPPPSILRSHAMLTSAGALTCTITVCIWIDTARNSVLCGNSLLNSSYGKLPGDLQVIPCID